MPSLSTEAGSLNPKSFTRIKNVYADIYRDKYVNDSFDSRTLVSNNQLMVASGEIFRGKVLTRFHRRKNRGDLLPMTEYRKVSDGMESTSTPTTLSFGVTSSGDAIKYVVRTLAGNIPMNRDIPPNGSLVYQDLDILQERGIDPSFYVQLAAASLYERGWDAATFLAEFHKVIAMFRQAVPKLISLVKEWRRYKKNGGKLYKSIDEWLETRYGWRILWYDVQEISSLIKNLDEKVRNRTKERAGMNDNWSETLNFTAGGSSHKRHCEVYRTYNLQVRGSIIADFVPSKVLMNPALTAWELLTFSFIVDWFIGIGKAISAFSFVAFSPTYTASYGYHLHRRSESSVTHVTFEGSPWSSSGWSTEDEQSKIRTTEWFVRVPSEVPILPYWRINLNAFKVADLVAILIKTFGKR